MHIVRIFLAILLHFLVTNAFDHDVTAACPDDVISCEFDFRLSYNWTMMRFIETGRMNPVIIHEDGSLWHRWKNCTGETELSNSEIASLLVGDGTHKMVMTINGQLPGPPIIVHENQEDDYKGDYIMMVQDWMHDHSREIYHRLKFDLLRFPFDYSPDQCYGISTQADGLQVGVTPFVSALINGKGRLYNKTTSLPVNGHVPLENYVVERGSKYRFRLISASMTFSLRVSIDHHVLHVVSTEAEDLEELVVESLVVHPGERYDFWINAEDPLGSGLYWIRAENLEDVLDAEVGNRAERYFVIEGRISQKIHPGHTEAILRYDGATEDYPSSTRVGCTKISKCSILNCPFQYYPSEYNATCLPITELKSTAATKSMDIDSDKFSEYFLNFHFSGSNVFGAFKPNINGRVHVPTLPRKQSIKEMRGRLRCDACYCTHIQQVPLGHVIQLVIFVHLPDLEIDGITGTSHPVHMHGHQAELVKIAFPYYDNNTGLFAKNNPDIECLQANGECNEAKWTNETWMGWDLPGSVAEAPIRKDTFIVPAGGYLVVRFEADNPGYWYLHCHVEYHNEIGMAMVLQEGAVSEIPSAPDSMKTCGDFDWNREQFLLAVNDPKPPGTPFDGERPVCGRKKMVYRVTVFLLVVVTGILTISAIHKMHSRAAMHYM
ncbi:hypothetical protein CAPTEDRAFT_204209 [Capitella teleta]|uniref:Plastocyanin-like domain-containing protein n=1 Tax=Capitella teleta TaxID=283909 RepID=R7UJE9_CAPTE|nr:hypothetical protein CAPTEDRAFT_204209 [Capitella teleta]|eukprot:ELU06335.1 hypothetical protein CAPTEDRAFT_204209 [Capitella teleta]